MLRFSCSVLPENKLRYRDPKFSDLKASGEIYLVKDLLDVIMVIMNLEGCGFSHVRFWPANHVWKFGVIMIIKLAVDLLVLNRTQNSFCDNEEPCF